jgi:hypothetical protein
VSQLGAIDERRWAPAPIALFSGRKQRHGRGDPRARALFWDVRSPKIASKKLRFQSAQQTRAYSRFSDAADDVVTARIYQGIHFRFADAEARKQGRHVAQWAFAHFLKPLGDDGND